MYDCVFVYADVISIYRKSDGSLYIGKELKERKVIFDFEFLFQLSYETPM